MLVAAVLSTGAAFVPSDSKISTFTDARDGTVYKIKRYDEIGSTWFIENLRYDINGSKFPDGKDENVISYGKLYNSKMLENACPEGWHVPTGAEWASLLKHYGGYVYYELIKTGNGRSIYDSYLKKVNVGKDPAGTIDNLNAPGSGDFNIQFAGKSRKNFDYEFNEEGHYFGSMTSANKKFFSLYFDNGISKYAVADDRQIDKNKVSNKFWMSCRCVQNKPL